ncbi:MAG: Gfo/Idh/MocA family oxidoreductase [Verrucomicrobiae bacterium]|nr:Gfo/Idh/MocA family oxidoreductase [Verrucomicrobiae bacterium]
MNKPEFRTSPAISLTRRQFVTRSAALAVVGLPFLTTRRVLGANDEIRMALVGCGGRGDHHISKFGSQKGVRFVAVCDPDRVRLKAAADRIEKKYKYRPAEIVDVRKLMERKDVDAFAIATMQYWHSLPTIWACETGRHVYVEKPLAHFIWEGRQMVNAARKYNRLVEVGTQGRSRETDRQCIEFIRSGQLGKIQYIVCFANKPRSSIGKRAEPLPIPDTVDYELWCGPARKEPIYRDRLQYDCSFIWNTGDGESCNQGVHELDIARWLLGETGAPRRVMSIGGRFVFNDAGDVPNTQICYYDYPSAPVLYEVHNLRVDKNSKEAPNFRGSKTDVCVQCEGGYVMMHAGRVVDNNGKEIKRFTGGEDHFENFIKALRTGNRGDLRADVLDGHISTNICHAGNISYRLGRKATAAEMRAQIGNLPLFQEMLDRYLAHLKAHDVDPGESILGPWLEWDEANERFKDNAEANKLVRGFYRKPFDVPEVKA